MIRKNIINFVGYILLFLGISMFFTSLWSLYFNDNDFYAFIESGFITTLTGLVLILLSKKGKDSKPINLRDGFYLVTITWIFMGLFCSLPYYQSIYFNSFVDAFFESMSGITTTGATIIGSNLGYSIEELPHGILFWRSFTQFIGGMGIILFTIAILPILGMGGVQLFRAEVPGPSTDKLTPRIKETAKYLWGIYLGLIILETVVLYIEGILFNIDKMTFFNALCHSMTTISTAGFSTFNNSIAGFESDIVSWTVIIFMFLGATNFSLHFLLISKKSFEYFNDSEFKFYVSTILFFFFLTFINISGIYGYTFQNITASLFNTMSLLTTTGYTLYDYETWPPLSQLVVFFMFFIGGMAGSTTGGIKLIRTILVVKYIKTEITRMLHPKGLHHVKIGKNIIDDNIVRSTLGFYLFYILIFAMCALIISVNGLDMVSSLAISASSIGNIGPGLGSIGPSTDWGSLNDFSKLLAMFCMLLGRLEIFTVIVLFSRTYWKS